MPPLEGGGMERMRQGPTSPTRAARSRTSKAARSAAGHGAAALVHDGQDGLGDGASVKGILPVASDQFESQGLGLVDDEVAHA